MLSSISRFSAAILLTCAAAITFIQVNAIPISSFSSSTATFSKVSVLDDNYFKKPITDADYQTIAKRVLEKRDGDGVITRCTTPGTLAMTFDDGPYQYTPELLDYLSEQGVEATFFVNGASIGNLQEYGDVAKRAFDEGHQIGSHTWSHADLTTLSESEIEFEMGQLDEALKDLIGVRPVFMRPPYGYVNSLSMNFLRNNGYKVVTWSIDTNDWRHPNDISPSVNAYQSSLSDSDAYNHGYIALQHDTLPQTARTLAHAVVQYAKDNGIRLVTVGECLGISKEGWYRD
ncbi:hypothetical protein EDD11_009962 [Mortierella claussenii]|nr:hypothetical protein EDD11_009962 [Mortierella claussenii]